MTVYVNTWQDMIHLDLLVHHRGVSLTVILGDSLSGRKLRTQPGEKGE